MSLIINRLSYSFLFLTRKTFDYKDKKRFFCTSSEKDKSGLKLLRDFILWQEANLFKLMDLQKKKEMPSDVLRFNIYQLFEKQNFVLNETKKMLINSKVDIDFDWLVQTEYQNLEALLGLMEEEGEEEEERIDYFLNSIVEDQHAFYEKFLELEEKLKAIIA